MYSVAYEIDQKYGTDYLKRFKKWLTDIQDENLMVVGAMTDPKGDRSKSPTEQSDPDQYVHVIDRKDDGVIIRGAKLHMTGAVSYLAQIQGTAKGSHIKDKVTEMILLCETLYSSSIACSAEGCPTPSGAYMVDSMLANVCKQNVTRFHFEVARIATDIAGGFIATMPSEYDLKSEDVGHIVRKYFSGVSEIPVKDRIKIGRLIEAMTGGTAMVESMHGAGSPQAQRIMIFREGKLDEKIKLAKALARIPNIKKKRKQQD